MRDFIEIMCLPSMSEMSDKLDPSYAELMLCYMSSPFSKFPSKWRISTMVTRDSFSHSKQFGASRATLLPIFSALTKAGD
jgi:hypothetical protein